MALKEKNGSPKYTKDTKFHGNPSRGCSEILLKTTNDNTMVALEVKINKVRGIHFLGTMNVCKKTNKFLLWNCGYPWTRGLQEACTREPTRVLTRT